MNYALNQNSEKEQAKKSTWSGLKNLVALMAEEKKVLLLALGALVINSGVNLVAPIVIAHVIDTYIPVKDYQGVLFYGAFLLGLYLLGLGTSYVQTQWMGGVGQRILFKLRNAIFNKLQELPVAFFNQNKAGDLISRINNDTDKLNQFFSQSLVQFMGNLFIMAGAGVFLLSIHLKLGAATLAPAMVLLFITQVISPWIKRKNAMSMQSTGGLSAEIQESLDHFKVIVAFNRRDYFRKKFEKANQTNYKAAVGAGLGNTLFTPIYGLSSNIAQLIVIAYGITLISQGDFTLGLLIGFLTYSTRFYDPLRQLAALWANLQVALAGWDRISKILALKTNLISVEASEAMHTEHLLEFKNVHFTYPEGKEVLKDINFILEPGKTYALVGPTGGGKTTTASLMARLYDPTAGEVRMEGRDLRSYSADERSQNIGFILQEPFLFTGTVKENILYGQKSRENVSDEALEKMLEEANLKPLLDRFEKGLETPVSSSGDALSLGQKQLLAFIRAVLRNPKLLILDEATANIDTVTEQLLEDILKKLPSSTTRVIIAHRLNTIANADEIFFVNGGEFIQAGSMDHALSMLMENTRTS